MPYNVTATYTKEAAKLEGTYPVDMYVLNASLSGWEPLYYVNLNQDIAGFSLNASGNITNNATIYTGLPIERGDLGTNTSGEIGEVSISIPNTNRVIESIIQNRKYLRGRDVHIVSGFARHLPSSGIIEDETGASWGPTVHGLSLAMGSAFLKVSGVDLSPYANKNYKITLTDSAGKKVVGYIGAVDAAETLGPEQIANGAFTSNITDWTTNPTYPFETFEWDGVGKLHGANTVGAPGFAYSANFSVTAGKLYKVTFDLTLTSGTAPRIVFANSVTGGNLLDGVTTYYQSVNGSNTCYFTPNETSVIARYFFYCLTAGSDFLLDNVVVKEVTHVGATGVHIVSTSGGSTRNWASIEPGFNYNDTSYTFDITYNVGYLESDKYIGIAPDKNAFLKEKMYIDNVISNDQAVTFNCKSKFNIKNVVLPRRAYYKECTWAIIGRYAASECSPQSTVNTASYPTCDGTLDNCRIRKNSSRFGGFPSIPKMSLTVV